MRPCSFSIGNSSDHVGPENDTTPMNFKAVQSLTDLPLGRVDVRLRWCLRLRFGHHHRRRGTTQQLSRQCSPPLNRLRRIVTLRLRIWRRLRKAVDHPAMCHPDLLLHLKFIYRPGLALAGREHSAHTIPNLIQRVLAQDIAPISAKLILDVFVHFVPSEAINLGAGRLQNRVQLRRPSRDFGRIELRDLQSLPLLCRPPFLDRLRLRCGLNFRSHCIALFC